jgi:hypothetical protein
MRIGAQLRSKRGEARARPRPGSDDGSLESRDGRA